MTPSSRALLFLTRRYGNLAWDGVVRGSGVLALLAIPGVLWLPTAFGGLVGFTLVTIWVNGPLGIFLPATYEPILMLFGRVYPPLLVGFVGILGVLYVEYLNYHLYGKLLHLEGFRVVRESRTVRRVVGLFRRAPFFTVWLCSWSPLPYWAVRILAPISRYPTRKYLLATFLGRFPRCVGRVVEGRYGGPRRHLPRFHRPCRCGVRREAHDGVSYFRRAGPPGWLRVRGLSASVAAVARAAEPWPARQPPPP